MQKLPTPRASSITRHPGIDRAQNPLGSALWRGEEDRMLYYALVFLILGLVASMLGAYGVAAVASQIAWVLFVVGIVLVVVHLVSGRRTLAPWRNICALNLPSLCDEPEGGAAFHFYGVMPFVSGPAQTFAAMRSIAAWVSRAGDDVTFIWNVMREIPRSLRCGDGFSRPLNRDADQQPAIAQRHQ
jgi:uncharacterized membrane protein YtjA (UPF0391 family)